MRKRSESSDFGRVDMISAPSLDECKRKLDSLFGERGYSIQRKRQVLLGGFFGFGQKEGVEVMYRIENQEQVPSEPPRSEGGPLVSAAERGGAADFERTKSAFMRMAALSARGAEPPSARGESRIDEKLDDISAQLQKLKVASGEVHPSIKKIEDLLSDNDFSPSFIREMSERIKSTFPVSDLDNFDKVQAQVVDWIGESISIARDTSPRPPRVIVIVGPTGVGKTTTIAKMASQMVKDARKDESHRPDPRMVFVTIDAMRVGALEQLSKFGDVLETQVQKAESLDDLEKIYNDVKGSVDVIFIDTSGYSPNDSERIGKMKYMLQVNNLNPDVYLAVSATTKARDLENIMENYEPFHYGSIIVTKRDESRQYGNVISVAAQKRKSISYVTDGQYVSRDIHRASVVDFLTRLQGFAIDRVHIEDKFGDK